MTNLVVSRQAWEKNWLIEHNWSLQDINRLEDEADETPVEYLTNEAEFCGLRLQVNRSVLIPRLETEKLVLLALDWFQNNQDGNRVKENTIQVVEVGTGSGAIAVALATRLQKLNFAGKILTLEISEEARKIADVNIQNHNLHERIIVRQNNLLTNITNEITKLANDYIIIANLPYIPSQVVSQLETNVRDYEPWLALDGGPDGFDLIAELLEQIKQLKKQPRLILLEIDPSHAENFKNLKSNFAWKIMTDFNNLARYAVGELI